MRNHLRLGWRKGLSLGLFLIAFCTVLASASPAQRVPERTDPALVVAASPADQFQQGQERYTAGQFAEAATLWQQSAQRFASQQDPLNQAISLSNLSLAYQQLGKWEQARQAVETSLQLVGDAGTAQPNLARPRLKPHQLPILAQALNTQASLLQATGQPETALTTWQRAEQAYQAAGDKTGVLRSRLNQVQALRSLGFYRRALTTLTEVNQTLQSAPNSGIKAVTLRALGNTLRLVGDLQQAERVLRQSLEIPQSEADRAATWLSLGNLLRTRQQPTNALAAYQQAATLTAASPIQVQALLNQLALYREQQQWAAIPPLLPLIQTQLDNLPPSHTSLYARINLAANVMKLAEAKALNTSLPQAARLLATAIQQARSLGDRRAESYALGTLGHVYEAAQQWQEAQAVTQDALMIAQAMNASDISYQWQWQLGRLLQAQNRLRQATAAYSEAVSTLQTLRNDLVSINTDVQFSFRESVEPVYRELVALLLQEQEGKSPSQADLARARSVIESLQMAELENFFQEACLQARPVLIDQVDPKAAVLYPVILPDRLEVILSLPGQPLRHYTTAIPQAQLEATLDQMRQSLSPVAPSRDRLRLTRQVYDWLIRPVVADLNQASVTTLVFVLDGSLRNLPMAALYDGQQYLVEKYTIALTPGLQLLAPRPLTGQKLQALKGGLSESRQGFAPLPNVARELEQISATIPGTMLLNQNLTRSNLETDLNATPFNIVHLATHGQFSSNADNTFILTWDGRVNVKQLNDLLRNRDLSRPNPLELLVLSACQTASGDRRAALGMAGVAIRSGARSTLATLWSVNDEAAAELMVRFYRALTQPGMTKGQALRQAQLELLKQPQYRQPYYWAPFVMIGNWQ